MKSFAIDRYEYVKSCIHYNIEINDTYLTSINDWLKQRLSSDECLTKPEVMPVITVQDAYNIMRDDCQDDKYNVEYRFKSLYSDYEYTSKLCDMVHDWIEEDLWDQEVDTDYYGGDGWEDEYSVEEDEA